MAPRELGQQRQEGLGHAVGAEEVDGQVLLEHGTIAQVVIERDAGVVDEDVERPDLLGRGLDLRRAGHVQDQGGDAPVRVGQGLPRARVHPAGASAEGFGDERLPDAAIGPGHQDGLAVDTHVCSSSSAVLLWFPRRLWGGPLIWTRWIPGIAARLVTFRAFWPACEQFRPAAQRATGSTRPALAPPDPARNSCGRPNDPNNPVSWKAIIRAIPVGVTVGTSMACA